MERFSSYRRRSVGEGSSASAEDNRRKRARVYFDFDGAHSAIAGSSNVGKSSASAEHGDCNDIQESSVRSNDDALRLMSSGEGSNFDEGDDSDIANVDDQVTKMDLTDDLLHMVFSFLDHPNLCKAARVCNQWRTASAHEDFWKSLNFEDRNISVEQFEDICRRYPKIATIRLSGPPSYQLVMKAVSSLRNLEALTLGRGNIMDSFFHALADCSMLRRLSINDAVLGSGIQEISVNHDRLCHLQLTKCRVMRIAVRCPQLETMSLKRSNMAQTVLNCPLLQELDIGSCHKLPDSAIRSAVTSCPQLVSLDMSNCSCVSDETLREIAQNCAHLSFLDASYCPNVSLETVRLPMLTTLKLHSCEGITSASMAAIAYSSMLEVLELDNCSLLTSVSLDLPRLQNIRLVHCRKFADLNLMTLTLSSILVSNCPVLHRINITSNSLQKLTIPKQDSLTTLALQCQSLQEVDLSECESLNNSVCNVFNDGGGCPVLKSLILDNCESLTSVQFISTSLICLSLGGCRAITNLDLTCPNLEKLVLDGCDHLERASFCPVGLSSLNLGICPKLSTLSIEAPYMVSLELKGCGVLSEAFINFPLLTTLGISFCRWGDIEFPLPFGRVLSPTESFIHSLDDKTSASLKFTVLNPKGRIWTMVAGGGASVIYADTVGDLGYASELGNYAEYSGAPNEEEVLQYARVVIDCATADPDGRKRALLIGGGIANFTDVAATFSGIIRALKEKESKLKAARVHIFVRRGGPNYQTGLAKMRALGEELGVPIQVYGPEATMTGICKQAIDCIISEA